MTHEERRKIPVRNCPLDDRSKSSRELSVLEWPRKRPEDLVHARTVPVDQRASKAGDLQELAGIERPSRRTGWAKARYTEWIRLALVEAILILDWLLEHNVSALIRVDVERGKRPWTFHASGGPLAGSWVRVDAETPEECLRRAVEQLSKAGLEIPDGPACS